MRLLFFPNHTAWRLANGHAPRGGHGCNMARALHQHSACTGVGIFGYRGHHATHQHPLLDAQGREAVDSCIQGVGGGDIVWYVGCEWGGMKCSFDTSISYPTTAWVVVRIGAMGVYVPYAVANHHTHVFQQLHIVDRWCLHTGALFYFVLNLMWYVLVTSTRNPNFL